MTTRRQLLTTTLVGSALTHTPLLAQAATQRVKGTHWTPGTEGQRQADLGNGTYLNPVLAGDHPDPSVLRDGQDYWLTFSSFESLPGLQVWHSRDLLNWQPVANALQRELGNVFAPDLCRHGDRYYIYFPIIPTAASPAELTDAAIFVVHAPNPRGPWSEPVDTGLRGVIDPGHVVGEDGHRYLFVSGVGRVRLSDDGLKVIGRVEPAYAGWRYPDHWVTEAYALEGPKLLRRGEWFYLISAVGGTSGPPTSHMVIAARSRSVHGPWENAPHNPIVRTRSASERWWSRGHATLVQGPRGDWWLVYHGYENGYRTLGRQFLMEPVRWTTDGWPVALGGDLSSPLPTPQRTPTGRQIARGLPLSDDFSRPRFGQQWLFAHPSKGELARARLQDGALVLNSKGTSPANASPLTCNAGDHAYEIEVEIELMNGATGGLLLFYSDRLYCGLAHDGQKMITYRAGQTVPYWREPAGEGSRWQLRIINDHHIVTFYYRRPGEAWQRHGLRLDTSGYDTNTADGLFSLRPALLATASGVVQFRNFNYHTLA